MHKFEVWAPGARTVEVTIGEKKTALDRGDRGWWSANLEEAGPGADYLFSIDGAEPAVPDPRSRWQPQGVHGPSRIFDAGAFAWDDAKWQAPPLSGAIIYELHIGTFTQEGTLAAVEARLSYLKDLGITYVELMPVAAFPGDRGWGYDGVDLYAAHEVYGGPAALQHFVNVCHGAGLAVLLDVVYNHLGPDGNYLGKFGPYLTTAHSTPWGGAMNLEEAWSTEVRRFLIGNAKMWLEDFHFDGLRLDAVHALIDRSATHFLEELASEVRLVEARLGKKFVVVAESDLNDPRLVTAPEAGGFGLDAQWSDDFHHALVAALTGETQGYYEDFGSLANLAKSLEAVYVYDGGYSKFRRRNHGRPVENLPRSRFLGFAQNHDQIGNRAQGERLAHLVSPGRTKMAAALVLTSPFVPLLFQGEEFGASAPFQYFTGFEDKELGRLVSEGRKKEFAPFGWKPEQIPGPQDEETFRRSKLDWSELDKAPHKELLEWHKDLIRLRRNTADLHDDRQGATRVRFDEQRKWIVVERGSIRVMCNLGRQRISLDAGLAGGGLLLASDPRASLKGGTIELDPDCTAILRAQQ